MFQNIVSLLILISSVIAEATIPTQKIFSKVFHFDRSNNVALKIYLTPDFSMALSDSNFDGQVDRIQYMSPKYEFEYSQLESLIKITKFSKDKRVLIYNSRKINQIQLSRAYRTKIERHYRGEASKNFDSFCADQDQNSIPHLSDQLLKITKEPSMAKLDFGNCETWQKEALSSALSTIQKSTYLAEDTSSCLFQELSKQNNGEVKNSGPIISKFITKLEQINLGNTQVKISCGTIGVGHCRLAQGSSILEPDLIEVCFNPGPLKSKEGFLINQILLHEMLHSKHIELTDLQIEKLMSQCEKNDSPLFSNLVADDKATTAAKKEADSVEFNPGAEYQTLKNPPIPNQQMVQKAFNNPNDSFGISDVVSPNEPIMNYAKSIPPFLNTFFSGIPVAEAESSRLAGSKVDRTDFSIHSGSGSSAKLNQNNLSSADLLHGIGSQQRKNGAESLETAADSLPDGSSKTGETQALNGERIPFKDTEDDQTARKQLINDKTKQHLNGSVPDKDSQLGGDKGQSVLANRNARGTKGPIDVMSGVNTNTLASSTRTKSTRTIASDWTQLIEKIENLPRDEFLSLTSDRSFLDNLNKAGITVYIKNEDGHSRTPYGANPTKSKWIFAEDKKGVVRKFRQQISAGDEW